MAAAIDERLRTTGRAAVALDMRDVALERFSHVVEALRAGGLEPAAEPVPVAPAAHYTMGGVAVDAEGRASVAGLYAVGECACTGLHGANRLASNSLSECFVFGRRAARAALDEPEHGLGAAGPKPRPDGGPTAAAATDVDRVALWRHAGLVRDAEGLERLLTGAWHPLVGLIGRAARARAETRGAHRRRDAPRTDPALDLHHAVIRPGGAVMFERWE